MTRTGPSGGNPEALMLPSCLPGQQQQRGLFPRSPSGFGTSSHEMECGGYCVIVAFTVCVSHHYPAKPGSLLHHMILSLSPSNSLSHSAFFRTHDRWIDQRTDQAIMQGDIFFILFFLFLTSCAVQIQFI